MTTTLPTPGRPPLAALRPANLQAVTVTTFPIDAYVCQCPAPHPMAPDDADPIDVYLRISEDKTGQEMGVERQMHRTCRKANVELGRRIGRVWMDNDISATDGSYRPAFEGLLAAKPKDMITWHSDRFVRLTDELERVIKLNINVYSCESGYFDLSHPAGRATAKTVTAWAQYEGEQKSLRQKAANLQRAQAGKPWWTRRPFGFELDGTHRENEAKALRKVYGDFVLTGNLSECARWLNDQGFRTSTYRARKTGEIKGGEQWNTTSLRLCLEAARNAAIRTYTTKLPDKTKVTEEVGPAGWEPIVPEEVWRAAVHKLRTPGRRTNNTRGGRAPRNMLTGIAVCGLCGETVRVRSVGRQGRVNNRYYSCGGSDKAHIAHPVEWADSVVLNEITRLLQDPAFHEAWRTKPVTDPAEAEVLRVERAACVIRIEEADEDRATGDIDRKAHLTITRRQRERIEQIDTALEEMGSQSQLAVELADLELVWQEMDGMSLAQRRSLVTKILDRIELLPGIQGKAHSRDDVQMTPRLPKSEIG